MCKRIDHLLTIDGHARIDLRLNAQNELYFIEANPNPALAPDEDFAESGRRMVSSTAFSASSRNSIPNTGRSPW
ncbi:MAG TPA: hypothetical protein VIM71_11310 [Lacunisphaera sp.]